MMKKLVVSVRWSFYQAGRDTRFHGSTGRMIQHVHDGSEETTCKHMKYTQCNYNNKTRGEYNTAES